MQLLSTVSSKNENLIYLINFTSSFLNGEINNLKEQLQLSSQTQEYQHVKPQQILETKICVTAKNSSTKKEWFKKNHPNQTINHLNHKYENKPGHQHDITGVIVIERLTEIAISTAFHHHQFEFLICSCYKFVRLIRLCLQNGATEINWWTDQCSKTRNEKWGGKEIGQKENPGLK